MRSYVRLLRQPGLGLLFGAALLARMPYGVNGIAVLLFLREETGSFAVPGAASAGLAIGLGVGAPLMSRVVDRRGAAVIAPLAVANAGSLIGLVLAGSAGAPPVVLVALATLGGLMFPPTPSVLRARLPGLVGAQPGLVRLGFALDSVLLEAAFVIGPLGVGVIAAVAGAAEALILSAATILVGSLAFLAALPAAGPPSEHARAGGMWGALASPGLRALIATMIPLGIGFGAIELALTAFGREESGAAAAGALLAAWAVGSTVGGLLYGPWSARNLSVSEVFVRISFVLPAGFALLALGWSVVSMAILAVPAGLAMAPLLASRNELAGALAPRGRATEALTWPLTALMAGIALGAAAAGVLVDAAGWQAAVAAGVGAALVGAVLTLAWRSILEPAASPGEPAPARV